MQLFSFPLANIDFWDDEIKITRNLRIRLLSGDERAAWIANPTALRYADRDELEHVTHIIEQTEASDSSSPMEQEAAENLFTLMALLEFFMPERLRVPFMEHVRFVGHARESRRIYEHRESPRRDEIKIATHVRPIESDLHDYWTLLVQNEGRNRRLRRALGRYTLARAAHFAEDAVLQATIGLECLFSPESERNNTNVVAGSLVAWLHDPEIPRDPVTLVDSFEAFKRDYRYRSHIVHGKIVPEEGQSDAAKALVEALRVSITIALGLGVSRLDPTTLFGDFMTTAEAELRLRHIDAGARRRR